MLVDGRVHRAASTAGRPIGSLARRIGWPAMLVAVALLAQLVLGMFMTRGAWLTADPLYYITERGALPDVDKGLFASHRGHWLTVPIMLYRVLFPVFGLAHGWPYLLVSLLLHCSLVLVLYALLRRASWGSGMAALSVVPVAFLGAGSQAFVADHPMPLLLSLFLGLAALLQFSANRPGTGPVAGAGLLLLSVMSSGVGLTVLVTAGVWLLLRRGLRAALVGTTPAGLAFLAWYLVYGRDFDRAKLGGWDYLGLPRTVWQGATTALENASGVPDSGAVLLAVLVAAPLLLRDLPPAARDLAWAGQVGALTQLVLSAIGGGAEGYPPVTESRYGYIVLVLLTPSLTVVALALRRVAPQPPRRALVALGCVLAAGYVLNALFLQRQQADAFVDVSSGLRDRVVGTVAATKAGERVLTPHPSGLSSLMDVRLMTARRIAVTLPKKPADEQQTLDAESEFFVGVSRKTFGLFAPTIALSDSFSQPLFPGKGCATFTTVSDRPEIAVDSEDGVEIAVKGPSKQVTTRVERGKLISASRAWTVPSGIPIHIATTARDARLVASFDGAGEYTICKH